MGFVEVVEIYGVVLKKRWVEDCVESLDARLCCATFFFHWSCVISGSLLHCRTSFLCQNQYTLVPLRVVIIVADWL